LQQWLNAPNRIDKTKRNWLALMHIFISEIFGNPVVPNPNNFEVVMSKNTPQIFYYNDSKYGNYNLKNTPKIKF
jgi:hypothetical protein